MKGVVDSGDLGSVLMAYDVWHKPYSPYNRPEWMLDRERGGGMGQMDGTSSDRPAALDNRLRRRNGVGTARANLRIRSLITRRSIADDTGMYFIRWKSGIVACVSRIAWDRGATEYGGDYFFTDGMARFRLPVRRRGHHRPCTSRILAIRPRGARKTCPQRDSLLDEFTEFIRIARTR